jgi:hypothetical protein
MGAEPDPRRLFGIVSEPPRLRAGELPEFVCEYGSGFGNSFGAVGAFMAIAKQRYRQAAPCAAWDGRSWHVESYYRRFIEDFGGGLDLTRVNWCGQDAVVAFWRQRFLERLSEIGWNRASAAVAGGMWNDLASRCGDLDRAYQPWALWVLNPDIAWRDLLAAVEAGQLWNQPIGSEDPALPSCQRVPGLSLRL